KGALKFSYEPAEEPAQSGEISFPPLGVKGALSVSGKVWEGKIGKCGINSGTLTLEASSKTYVGAYYDFGKDTGGVGGGPSFSLDMEGSLFSGHFKTAMRLLG